MEATAAHIVSHRFMSYLHHQKRFGGPSERPVVPHNVPFTVLRGDLLVSLLKEHNSIKELSRILLASST